MEVVKELMSRSRESTLRRWTAFLAFAVLAIVLTAVHASQGGAQIGSATQPSDPWKPADLIEPRDLAAILRKPAGKKPVVLYVGFPFLYKSAHIPGAIFLGAGRTPEGLAAIRKWAQTLAHGQAVVIYCGCCPWRVCPNVRGAFKTLREAGVTDLKLVYLEESLLEDWISKGYPIEKGS